MRAHVARGRARTWLVRKLAELCAEMGTAIHDEGRAVRVTPAAAAERSASG
jgi:hypothetical protein